MAQEIVLRLQVPEGGGQPVLVHSDAEGDPMSVGLPKSPLFQGLSQDALQEIAARARKRAFAAGSTIYEEGELADSAYIVVSGEVRRYRVDRETSTRENVVTLGVVTAGGTFGATSLITPSRIDSAESVRRSECLQFMKDELMALMIRFPLFGLSFSQAALALASQAEERLCNFGHGRWSAKRLAGLLLKLAEEEGKPVEGGVEISRPLTQSDLASLIQAARETVSLQLKKLREQGAVSMKGKVITVMPARLREVSGL